MNKSTKGLLILLTPFLLGFLLGALVGGGCGRRAERRRAAKAAVEVVAPVVQTPEDAEVEDSVSSDEYEEPQMREVLYNANRPPYSKWFADLNEVHLRVADSLGLRKAPSGRDDVNLKGLVKIQDNRYYVVDDLRYSIPYLTKGAASELETIAKAFHDSLRSKNLLDYSLVVSSLLRTEEDVTRLQRSGNVNASDNSSHCRATTFDITYTRYWRENEEEQHEFMQPFELTKVLAEVLRDQKAAGRCVVKYERKEHCFHITSLVAR